MKLGFWKGWGKGLGLRVGAMGGGGTPADTTAPTVTITSTAATITAAAFTCTFTFSEAVTGFALGDITVANGSAGTFNTVSTSVYTAVITPTATGTVTVDVAAGVCTDAAGNSNTASNTFSILYVAVALWLKADAGVFTDDAATTPATADGNVIAVWQDQSGNAYHVSQTDNDKRPLLKLAANGINSRPTILFDGSNDLLVRTVADWLAANSSGSVIAAYKTGGTIPDNQTLFATSDTATTNYYVLCRNLLTSANKNIVSYQKNNDTADTIRGSTTIAISTVYITVWSSNGTAYAHRVNGAAQTLTAVAGADTGDWFSDTPNRDNFSVGALKFNSETGFFLGSLSEIFVFNTQVTGAALTAVESYLNTRYAAF